MELYEHSTADVIQNLADLKLATFQRVPWRGLKRLHQSTDYRTPEQVKTEYCQNHTAQAASL